jgi:hypothetical protein
MLATNNCKEGEMPAYFKALATIVVWILFISGCLATVMPIIIRISQGEVFGSLVAWAIGATCLILSVVAMKLRKGLE